ncbi:hypothetical protein M0R45_016341 [Rubus argutus]|uniref:Uncharacterized protein n=1 Tax=Rubus argutus TaxID=59490 RepID=A0AAW1XTC3_RUBAR
MKARKRKKKKKKKKRASPRPPHDATAASLSRALPAADVVAHLPSHSSHLTRPLDLLPPSPTTVCSPSPRLSLPVAVPSSWSPHLPLPVHQAAAGSLSLNPDSRHSITISAAPSSTPSAQTAFEPVSPHLPPCVAGSATNGK